MSWIPSGRGWDPTSRTAPRPAAAGAQFTFGHLAEQQAAGAAAGAPAAPGSGAAEPISTRPNKANFDPAVEELRWWQQPRSAATVAGSSNRDIQAFWAAAGGEPGAVAALVNAQARHTNKAQGLGSTIKQSLVDNTASYSMADAQSSYKSDLLAGHVRVGKRGVQQSAEAMAAYEESRKAAEANKKIGKSTNMKLGLF